MQGTWAWIGGPFEQYDDFEWLKKSEQLLQLIATNKNCDVSTHGNTQIETVMVAHIQIDTQGCTHTETHCYTQIEAHGYAEKETYMITHR